MTPDWEGKDGSDKRNGKLKVGVRRVKQFRKVQFTVRRNAEIR